MSMIFALLASAEALCPKPGCYGTGKHLLQASPFFTWSVDFSSIVPKAKAVNDQVLVAIFRSAPLQPVREKQNPCQVLIFLRRIRTHLVKLNLRWQLLENRKGHSQSLPLILRRPKLEIRQIYIPFEEYKFE